MAAGADMVAIDVRATKDGVLIAFHDTTLDRTTNGTGRVAETSYAKLRGLDAGWDFKRGRAHPFRGTGTRIPTLEEVLRRFSNDLASIELKDHRIELVNPTCALLRSLRRTNDVVVGSNNDQQLLAFRVACPEVRTSATMGEMIDAKHGAPTKRGSVSPWASVSQLPYGGKYGTGTSRKSRSPYLHRNGVAVLAWVVDEPADMKLLPEWGVDGIYT